MKSRFLYIALILLVTVIACSKTDNAVPSPAHIRFINATPDGNFDIYSNGEKILEGLTFDSVSGFASGLPGLYDLEIKNHGESDDLIQGHQQLQSGTYYTMYLIPDTTGKQVSSTKINISTVTENTAIPSRDSIKIRFLNLAPYTDPITVLMTIDGRTLTTDSLRPFTQRYFNDQIANSALTSFYFTFAYNWKMHFINTKDSTYLLDPFHYQFESQGIYTIYLKGTPGGTGEKALSYKIIKQDW